MCRRLITCKPRQPPLQKIRMKGNMLKICKSDTKPESITGDFHNYIFNRLNLGATEHDFGSDYK